MSKKQKQWNCRAGINGWHQENCPHQKPQSEWEAKSDEIVINFFEELRPPKKGESYTFLIPLMVDLKCNLEKAVKQAQAETLKEVLDLINKDYHDRDITIYELGNEIINKALKMGIKL